MAGTTAAFDVDGGGLANLMEDPVTAVRSNSPQGDIALTTGIWNQPAGKLGLKWLRTLTSGAGCATIGCQTSFTQARIMQANMPGIGLDFDWQAVYGSGGSPGNMLNVYDWHSHYDDLIPDQVLPCSVGYYRQQDGGKAPEEQGSMSPDRQIAVYPNPATDAISIAVSSDLLEAGGEVSATLMDMTGKVVLELYRGNAEGLSGKRLELPASLAGGLFIVQMRAQNGTAHQTRIAIQ